MDNGAVDGYALVSDLLAGVMLTANQVQSIVISPTDVVNDYLLLDDEGKPFSRNGDVARGRLSLPIDWTKP